LITGPAGESPGRSPGTEIEMRIPLLPSTVVAGLALLLMLLAPMPVAAQEVTSGQPEKAGVRVDGKVLFQVRGISAYPADQRARLTAKRIVDFARDGSVPVEAIDAAEQEDHYVILAGDEPLVRLYDFDADLEGIPLPVLTEVVVVRVREAVEKYRADRSADAVIRSGLYSAGLTVALFLLIWALSFLRRKLSVYLKEKVDRGMADLERKSGAAVHRGHLWGLAQGVLQVGWVLVLLIVAYFYLSSVLGTFPWTRGAALLLLDYIRTPLVSMGNGLIRSLPNLAFLLVLWFVVRFLLRALRQFSRAIRWGRVRLAGFEPEWAEPTYRLLRIAIIAFAVVVAYPYIPGSDSAAFKGVSLFLGVIFSLGSTSFIANLIAGTALTYRGVFKVGDWVKIGDEAGRVEEIRSQVVRLRTRDNEQVTIPSSTILNSNVTNLSTQGESEGLVLRCRVGLGYDVDWRDAERLMLEAASETEGVLQEPAPFVNVESLDDFSVAHTLVVRIAEPGPLPGIRTRLNRAILDRFHAAGIQIMSPSYENDPEDLKIPRQSPGREPAPDPDSNG
jgi:small-conductance mechanosensitive channel